MILNIYLTQHNITMRHLFFSIIVRTQYVYYMYIVYNIDYTIKSIGTV